MARERKRTPSSEPETPRGNRRLIAIVSILSAAGYYFSNPIPNAHYDYTFRVAEKLLHGSVGFVETPPTWLNEFVPFEGFWYSVFPFGAVVSMLPFAGLKSAGIISGDAVSLYCRIVCGRQLFISFADRTTVTISAESPRILMPLGILFGTFAWTNITMGGAWQLALGFALGRRTRSDIFYRLQPTSGDRRHILCLRIWQPNGNSVNRTDLPVPFVARRKRVEQ